MDGPTIATIVTNLRNKLIRQQAAVKLTEASIEGFQKLETGVQDAVKDIKAGK